MPTSSQAMILRSNDQTKAQRGAHINVRFGASPFLDIEGNGSVLNSDSTEGGQREIVQFDFSLSTSPEHCENVNGIEGVFAFDEKSKSYRWQIFSLLPKKDSHLPKIDQAERGDHIDDETSVEVSDLISNGQPSESNRHFTTPSQSLMDNSEHQHLNYFSKQFKNFDESAYRRLEELGFRRRTTNSPRGNQIRARNGMSSPRPPVRCASAAGHGVADGMTKLTIQNLSTDTVPGRERVVPYSRPVLKPKTLVKGGDMRRRAPVTKPKSLLEEVKESVNWSSRVNPSTHARPVTAREHHNVVCFSLRDGHRFTSLQVKELVESQIHCKVKCLQYDPVSVRSGDSETLDRWIVTFDSAVTCGRALEHGLAVGGDRVLVRAWSDIVREEAMLDEWGQSCNFRLPQAEKHSRALHKFLKGVTV